MYDTTWGPYNLRYSLFSGDCSSLLHLHFVIDQIHCYTDFLELPRLGRLSYLSISKKLVQVAQFLVLQRKTESNWFKKPVGRDFVEHFHFNSLRLISSNHNLSITLQPSCFDNCLQHSTFWNKGKQAKASCSFLFPMVVSKQSQHFFVKCINLATFLT